jgi:hypothetical protein
LAIRSGKLSSILLFLASSQQGLKLFQTLSNAIAMEDEQLFSPRQRILLHSLLHSGDVIAAMCNELALGLHVLTIGSKPHIHVS